MSSIAMAVPDTDGNWPHIRGPAYDAHATWTNLHLPWTKEGPPLLWKISIGQGYSGFIVVDDKVFTQIQTRGGQHVVCLDINTGKVIWRSRYGLPWQIRDQYPGPYGTPTYANGRIYYVDCYGAIGCLNAGNGARVWHVDLDKKFNGQQGIGFGYACSPLVENGRVYIPVGGQGASVVALDAGTGDVIWKAGNEPASFSPCYAITVEGHRQIVSFLENIIVARDPETGVELWRDELTTSYDEHSSWPLYREPFLFYATPFQRGARVLRLYYENGAAKAKIVWKSKVMSNDIASSVLAGDCVYGFDVHDSQTGPYGDTKGEFKCIELVSGEELWATPRVRHPSILVCGDKLVMLSETGELIVASASREEYTELARACLLPKNICWTVPAIHNGRLIVRGRNCIACYYLGDPADISTLQIATAPVQPAESSGSQISEWFDHCQNPSFWAPSFKDLFVWYLASMFIFVLAWMFSLPAANPSARCKIIWSAAFVLALLGVPLFTTLAGVFVFTWPVALYLVFALVSVVSARATREPELAMQARLLMAAFAVVCFGYYFLCRNLFIVTGWGFLVGFLPAWPLTLWMAQPVVDRASERRLLFLSVLSFTVYFWSSALFTVWKTLGG
jgi:outer membrane protein assembly factor BamB